MNHIAVLLTVYNRKEKTLKCLKALMDSPLPENHATDVYLVDDGCTDGTGEAVKQQFPQVNVIRGTGNLFWNRGMNLAWTTAAKSKDYDFYLWLNDDTILYPDAVRKMIETSETENHQSIICGSTCATNDPEKITYGGRNTVNTIIIPNGQKQVCKYINGNILLVPKHVYSVVGTNDPYFLHALGDHDYGLRALKSGIKSIVAPYVLGVCNAHATFPTWCHPKTPVLKRFKSLYTPLGIHPIQYFVYEKRHLGLLTACFHFFTIHLRTLFPVLWKNHKSHG